MPQFLAKIKRKTLEPRVSSFPVVLLPSFVSFELGASLAAGYFTALFFAGPKSKASGRIPSLVVHIKNHRVHLHHWLLFAPALFVSLLLHFFILSPLVFYGVLGGIVAQGILHYDDWHIIAQKV